MRLTDEERNQMELSIYLPLMLTNLELDKEVFDKASFRIKKPYLLLLDRVGQRAHRHLHEVQSYLWKNRLKVEKLNKDEMFTTYLFTVRGYTEQRQYFNGHIRNQVRKLTDRYMK